jgi:hypothetical protein
MSTENGAVPIAYAIEDVPSVAGIKRTRVFNAVRDKELTARKAGKATIVERTELERWIKSLPTKGRTPDANATAAA